MYVPASRRVSYLVIIELVHHHYYMNESIKQTYFLRSLYLGFIDLTVAHDWVWLNLHRMSEGPMKQVSSAIFKKRGTFL